jgi:hypothetical protein
VERRNIEASDAEFQICTISIHIQEVRHALQTTIIYELAYARASLAPDLIRATQARD